MNNLKDWAEYIINLNPGELGTVITNFRDDEFCTPELLFDCHQYFVELMDNYLIMGQDYDLSLFLFYNNINYSYSGLNKMIIAEYNSKINPINDQALKAILELVIDSSKPNSFYDYHLIFNFRINNPI